MSAATPAEAEAVAAFVATLSPEGRAAFFDVYRMLVELGLQHLAAHPDEVKRIATAAERALLGERQAATTDAGVAAAGSAASVSAPVPRDRETPANPAAGVSGSEVLDACRPDHAPRRL
jgi:hypothetical protein